MRDDELKDRLRRIEFSAPGIGLDEVVQRRQSAVGPRGNRGLLRVAMAAAAVWVMVFVAQVAVERDLGQLVPASAVTVVQNGARRSPVVSMGVIGQTQLLEQLLAEEPGFARPTSRKPALPESGQLNRKQRGEAQGERQQFGGRWTYV